MAQKQDSQKMSITVDNYNFTYLEEVKSCNANQIAPQATLVIEACEEPQSLAINAFACKEFIY
jgi:hypothetical protein